MVLYLLLTYAHRSRWSRGTRTLACDKLDPTKTFYRVDNLIFIHGAQAINGTSPSHSVLGCSGHTGSVGPLLFQLCFSVSPPAVARPASLSLPLRVPGQGFACGDGCWLPEGVSDPAPHPPQNLLGHFCCCLLVA